jgi:transcriptional regulator with XRE-family HTH domain
MRNAEKTAVGVYLRLLRSTKSLSLREVERKIGVSNAVLSQIESGQVKRPSPHTLYKLAELYVVPYEELMARAGYPVPSRSAEGAQSAHAVFIRLGIITEDEEGELLDYLVFIRSRTQRGRNRE